MGKVYGCIPCVYTANNQIFYSKCQSGAGCASLSVLAPPLSFKSCLAIAGLYLINKNRKKKKKQGLSDDVHLGFTRSDALRLLIN